MQKPRTREERLAIIADWRESGLPRAAYARQHGLSEGNRCTDHLFTVLSSSATLGG